jgi:hypothetical protein
MLRGRTSLISGEQDADVDAGTRVLSVRGRSIPYMRRTFVVAFAVGLIVALFGVIWALQGFGVLQGSPMSNTTTWSIIGPVTALIGIVIAAFSWRGINSPRR